MNFSRGFLVFLFRALSDAVFRVHAEALSAVPQRGPLILAMNHVTILEIPLIFSRLQPRPVHGLVAAERWKNPLVAWGLNACGSIPLMRGAGNVDSLKKALDALSAGEMILMMPEGTRSGDGRLQTARPGVVLLALRSGAPVLPVVTYGAENYRQNLKRLRRTDIFLAVGRSFTFKPGSDAADSGTRQGMLDELMFQLAALLPPQYRGAYASAPIPLPQYIQFY